MADVKLPPGCGVLLNEPMLDWVDAAGAEKTQDKQLGELKKVNESLLKLVDEAGGVEGPEIAGMEGF